MSENETDRQRRLARQAELLTELFGTRPGKEETLGLLDLLPDAEETSRDIALYDLEPKVPRNSRRIRHPLLLSTMEAFTPGQASTAASKPLRITAENNFELNEGSRGDITLQFHKSPEEPNYISAKLLVRVGEHLFAIERPIQQQDVANLSVSLGTRSELVAALVGPRAAMEAEVDAAFDIELWLVPEGMKDGSER